VPNELGGELKVYLAELALIPVFRQPAAEVPVCKLESVPKVLSRRLKGFFLLVGRAVLRRTRAVELVQSNCYYFYPPQKSLYARGLPINLTKINLLNGQLSTTKKTEPEQTTFSEESRFDP
jgi:hypothetical protein